MKKILSLFTILAILFGVFATTPYSAAEKDIGEIGAWNSSSKLNGDPANDIAELAYAQNKLGASTLGLSGQWCAYFVSACAERIGQSTAIPYNGAVSNMYNAVVNAGGSIVSSPKKGDLVFYYYKGWCHVGIMIDSTYMTSGNMWVSGSAKVETIKYDQYVADGGNCYVSPEYSVFVRPNYSGNGTHTTHSYDTYVYNWDAHPHYKCYKCSCGEIVENTSEPVYLSNCSQCRVGKTTVYSNKKEYCTGERVELTWDAISNATHYNFYIMKKDSSGKYNERIDWITELEQTAYYIDGLSDGEYMIELYSYDKNHWEPDGSDWCHEMADIIYFTVSKDTKINQHIGMFYDNSRYELYNATMSWKDAKAYCERQGGHLVTITSQGEMDTVRELVSQGGRWCYYMGITDEDSEGNWKNITGEPINYTNWINGEPNNENGIEHYGVVRNIDGNNWNDVVNVYKNNPVGFICEYEFEDPTIMLGDTDSDGKVTIKDATTIQKHVAGITTISDEKFACADTDKDGKITVKDATRIQKFLAALLPEL